MARAAVLGAIGTMQDRYSGARVQGKVLYFSTYRLSAAWHGTPIASSGPPHVYMKGEYSEGTHDGLEYTHLRRILVSAGRVVGCLVLNIQ